MDSARPRAQAVAVTDGKITAVGSDREVAALANDLTEVIDFGGKVLGPGFVEPHSHVLLMALLLAPGILDVRSFAVPTYKGILDRIRAAINERPAGAPVVAFGLDPYVHGAQLPKREDLDAISSDQPLVIITLNAHKIAANSVALAVAGVTAETPDPPGGEIGRNEDGSLDGIFIEAPAVGLVLRPLLGLLDFDMMASLRNQAAELARAGITTIGELLVQEADEPALAGMRAMPDFPIRIRTYEATNATLTPHSAAGETDPLVRHTGLKLWVDGSPLDGKTLHKEPFLDNDMTRAMGMVAPCCGSANYSEADLLTIVRAYADSGLQFACHVQGDAATDRILNVYETVLTERGMIGTDHRWRLEHCGAMTKDQFERASQLGVTCSMFVAHVYYFGDAYVDYLFGPERGGHWMRLRSAVDSGIRISLHNDGYFTPPAPIASMQTAMIRHSSSGRPMGLDECIGIDDAMAAITTNAAWHLFSEHEVGSVEVGKFADFVELSADPYTVEPSELTEKVVVQGTWINGRRVDVTALGAADGS